VNQNWNSNLISISRGLLEFRLRLPGIHRNAHDEVDGRLLISHVLMRWLNDLNGGIMGLPLVRVLFEVGPTSTYCFSCLAKIYLGLCYYLDVDTALLMMMYTVWKYIYNYRTPT